MENIRTDLINYLFGDILATGAGDLANITIVALIGGALLYRLWQPLILMTISPAIARTEHPRDNHVADKAEYARQHGHAADFAEQGE